jgi:hypothetical protein
MGIGNGLPGYPARCATGVMIATALVWDVSAGPAFVEDVASPPPEQDDPKKRTQK